MASSGLLYRVAKMHRMQVISRETAHNYRALLWKITCKDKATCGSWPPSPQRPGAPRAWGKKILSGTMGQCASGDVMREYLCQKKLIRIKEFSS